MLIKRNHDDNNPTLTINGATIERVRSFQYFGTQTEHNNDQSTEIKKKTEIAS